MSIPIRSDHTRTVGPYEYTTCGTDRPRTVWKSIWSVTYMACMNLTFSYYYSSSSSSASSNNVDKLSFTGKEPNHVKKIILVHKSTVHIFQDSNYSWIDHISTRQIFSGLDTKLHDPT